MCYRTFELKLRGKLRLQCKEGPICHRCRHLHPIPKSLHQKLCSPSPPTVSSTVSTMPQRNPAFGVFEQEPSDPYPESPSSTESAPCRSRRPSHSESTS